MSSWIPPAHQRHPAWAPYGAWLDALAGTAFPGAAALNALLDARTVSGAGQSLRFAPPQNDGLDYETRVLETGVVETRPESWHDFWNALSWLRWPATKAAMNRLHALHRAQSGTGRGLVRDRLTHFDECGAVVLSSDARGLEALARRDWTAALGDSARCWGDRTQALILGHGLLDKCRAPYLAMTAHAVLVHVPEARLKAWPGEPLADLDAWLAERLLDGSICHRRGDLAPLPLAGIPGWWTPAPDPSFYQDDTVFRPTRRGVAPPAVLSV